MSDGPAAGRLPNLVIVGAAKAGTTSLWRYLAAHPDVYMYPAKEIHYFTAHAAEDVSWYRRHFEGAAGQRVVGEASPGYLPSVEAPARMAAVIPETRLIAMLRDPVERAYSMYRFRAGLREEQRSFGEVVAYETAPGEPPADREYLHHGRYVVDLARWCEHFPRSSLHVVFLEELQERPRDVYASVCRFLGIQDDVFPRQLGRVYNRTFSRRAWSLIGGLVRWSAREGWRTKARLAIEPAVPSSFAPMDPALRAKIVGWFAEDNAALATWLGRDLPQSWSR